MKKNIFIIFSISFFSSLIYSQTKLSSEDGVISRILSEMTKEEKIRMVFGTKMVQNTETGPTIGAVDTIVVGAAGATFEIVRLGIPPTVMADGPAGVRIAPIRNNTKETFYCTTFPGAMSLASTWNIDLVEAVGEAMGHEGKEYGADILLTPGLNIHRTPLCGRSFEYYSEDPVISGKMAAAIVRGIQRNGIGATIKHFAVNNQEISRSTSSSNLTERALREIYLKGFEISIEESSPWAVMSSYNKVNGVYTSESYDLLETILRKEWGYDGLVMSDWHGGKIPPMQMKVGNDLLMPGTIWQLNLMKKALEDGSLDESVLDKNIERILRYILKTPRYANYKYSDKPDLKKGANISYTAALEGIVLLKNENKTLPVLSGKRVALFGGTSYEVYKGGIGSGDVHSAYTISIYDGLKTNGFEMSSNIYQRYQNFLQSLDKNKLTKRPVVPRPEMELTEEDIVKLEGENDVAIFTIGRYNGEFTDIPVEYYYLTKGEKKLLETISKVFKKNGKPVIVILNTGSVVDISEWKNLADAVLSTWYSGQEAGAAIADIVVGKVNPSGKLASTIAAKYEDYPSSPHYPGYPIYNPKEIDYCEDIYVGYRYFDTFEIKPEFEFGFGLSYTTFAYSNFKISVDESKKELDISFNIKNIGNVAGKEVAQLYITAPSAGKTKPIQELKSFVKTNLLQPDEIQMLKMKLKFKDLASFSEEERGWIVEPGKYQLKVGSSSRDIKNEEDFSIAEEIKVSNTNAVLPLRKKIALLKP